MVPGRLSVITNALNQMPHMQAHEFIEISKTLLHRSRSPASSQSAMWCVARLYYMLVKREVFEADPNRAHGVLVSVAQFFVMSARPASSIHDNNGVLEFICSYRLTVLVVLEARQDWSVKRSVS